MCVRACAPCVCVELYRVLKCIYACVKKNTYLFYFYFEQKNRFVPSTISHPCGRLTRAYSDNNDTNLNKITCSVLFSFLKYMF